MRPSIPAKFYDNTSTLYLIFLEIAKSSGDTRDYVTQLFQLLPHEIKESAVWHDRLTRIWRYEFGLPYDNLPEDQVVIGTDQWPGVKYLYCAIRTANRYLTKKQLLYYIQRLEIKNKHLDVLFEMRPVFNLESSFSAKFEVEGYGEGNKTIDWLVKDTKTTILFDVKHRVKSFVNHSTQLIQGITEGKNKILPVSPNPTDLFKDTNKFLKRASDSILQGVWITTGIKEDKKRLISYFNNSIDHDKIQFAIISDWENDAYFLVTDNTQKEILKGVFNICESERFVCNDYLDS